MCKLIIYAQFSRQGGHNCDNRNKYCTRKRNTGYHIINENIGIISGLNPWNKTTVLLHIFRHLLWIHHDCGIEKCKRNDENSKRQRSEEHTSELQSRENLV